MFLKITIIYVILVVFVPTIRFSLWALLVVIAADAILYLGSKKGK